MSTGWITPSAGNICYYRLMIFDREHPLGRFIQHAEFELNRLRHSIVRVWKPYVHRRTENALWWLQLLTQNADFR
jgi:hypothetical protein